MGVTIQPTLALGGWAAFKPMGNMTMVMGDLVLLGTEINPVVSTLLEGGIEVTAIHNHPAARGTGDVLFAYQAATAIP